MTLKERIEQVLSEILSDKYECKVTLHFEKQETGVKHENQRTDQHLQ